MKKAYEVTYKDGNKFKTTTVKGYTLIGSVVTMTNYPDIYENLVAVNEINSERYYALNIASAIREADTWNDCEEECVELCRLAGMLTEWREADGDTFEEVVTKAAIKLKVEI